MHCRDTRGATPVLALPAAIQPRVPQAAGNKFCLKDTPHQVRVIHTWGFGMSGGLQTSEVFLIQTIHTKILIVRAVSSSCCHWRGVSVPKSFPKLNISSQRKRYEGHENVTLQAERFRRHVSHAEEFQVEYSVVKFCCDGRLCSPCTALSEQGTADSSAMCSGG